MTNSGLRLFVEPVFGVDRGTDAVGCAKVLLGAGRRWWVKPLP